MTDRSVTHGSFSVERTYPAAPQRVFAAWASLEAKDPWFGGGDDFLASVEVNGTAGGTKLVLTEQGAFLDGLDSNKQREEGARDSLDKLGAYLIRSDESVFGTRRQ